MIRLDIIERKSEIIEMIDDNEPKSRICKLLDCKPETLDSYLKKMGIEYKGNMGLKGKKHNQKRISALEYIKKETLSIPKLRRKLIEDGLKEDKCEKCKNSEWMGQKLTLELHHKDYDKHNNKLENLELLCPNCHSLTPNHSKKKTKRIPKLRIRKRKLKEEKIKFEVINYCECGNIINKNSKYCIDCHSKKQRKTVRPNIDILINEIKILGYSAVGRKYGVSDNAIRKWIKNKPL